MKMASLNNVEYIYITEKGNDGIFAISLLSNKPWLSTNNSNERLNNTLFSVFLVVSFLSQQLLVFLFPHLSSTHRHFNMIGVLNLLLVLGSDCIAIRIQQLGRNSETLFIMPPTLTTYMKRIFYLSSLVIFLISTTRNNLLTIHFITITFTITFTNRFTYSE